MKSNILPVSYPPITTFPPYADALSILCSHKDALKWVYSHYIQIAVVDIINRGSDYSQPFTPCFFVDFDNRRIANTIADCIFLNREMCPYLNVFEIPNTLITSMKASFCEVVKNLIDASMYIYGYVDVSKISDYSHLNGSEIPHEVFIYGYDDADKSFKYADLLNNESYKYTFSTCSYSEMELAFLNSQNLFIPIVKSFAAIQYVENAPFDFSYQYIKESIYEYIYPDKIKSQRYNDYVHSFLASNPEGPLYWLPKVYMGTNAYDYFSDYINYEFKHNNTKKLDRRLFHAMYDHKEMMILRLDFLLDRGYLSNEKADLIIAYGKVRDNALLIRNLILKYNISNRASTVDKIKELLLSTKTLETELLVKIFDL